MNTVSRKLTKRATGIPGLDHMTRGGLPARSATLVVGGAGAGKTVLCLQILAAGIQRGEGAVFVSFEESAEQVERDAESFTWGSVLRDSDRLRVIDARPASGVLASGDFDLKGLQAAMEMYAGEVDAYWVVLDGIDRLLSLSTDSHDVIRKISELNTWCEGRGIGLLITGKRMDYGVSQPVPLEGIEFMLDTVLVLSTQLVKRRLNRRFRIAKYRGTGHVTDELPMVLGDEGVHLPFTEPSVAPAAHTGRVGTGVARLDEILQGGLYRGSTTLISGEPGTAKTSLAAAFAEAAANRGERVLYVSFDELADRIIRNVASVGIHLTPHVESGRLRMMSREAWRALIEEHYIEIQRVFDEFRPDCLVIDPVSAFLKAAGAEEADVTMERLLGNARALGITTLITSLRESDQPGGESTISHASTLADTWITLNYEIRAGERNRALSVVKSRGAAHSNQVRELVLSSGGIDLADVYQFGSEVLMGTARIQKENEEAAERRRWVEDRAQRRRQLEDEIEEARASMEQARGRAERLERELAHERREQSEVESDSVRHDRDVRRARGERAKADRDGPPPGGPGRGDES